MNVQYINIKVLVEQLELITKESTRKAAEDINEEDRQIMKQKMVITSFIHNKIREVK